MFETAAIQEYSACQGLFYGQRRLLAPESWVFMAIARRRLHPELGLKHDTHEEREVSLWSSEQCTLLIRKRDLPMLCCLSALKEAMVERVHSATVQTEA